MRSILHLLAALAFLFVSTIAFWGQRPVPRISQQVDNGQRVVLKDSVHPLARPETDQGAVDGSMRVSNMSLVFHPSAAQQAALDQLLAEQQDRTSPNYHKWLTPEQYATRFGMSQQDIDKVTAWLEAQGFTVVGVSRGRNSIAFSGTAAQVAAAFHTQLHHYLVDGKMHFANATPASIPAAFSGVVLAVRNLNDFRPMPKLSQMRRVFSASPRFTSSISGNHFVAPDDFATIYDVKGLYNAGFDGSGQKLVVVGQTAIDLSDIQAFRSAANLPENDPELVLVPNTGGSAFSENDLGEADLDIEWSGGVAKNATVLYVYVGNNQNNSVFDALSYAIQNNLAPVISISYGDCEADFTKSNSQTVQQWAQQANTQGQTIVAAAGDTGAADCDGISNDPNFVVTSAKKGLSVDVPAAIPEVTGIGGNEFSGDVNNSTYWNPVNNANNGSAVSYIPETAWNDTNNGISAGGGGQSIFFPKPSWQSAPGVPQDSVRDVPDISLNASPNHDGYLVCSGGSCVNGFRDANSNLTVFGGTSAGAPSFAGILTLIEQATQSSGEGNVNSVLYQIAATPSTYASAFHDVTTGNNKVPCTSGTTNCPSGTTQIGFTAGPGYDQATGLGSVDAFNLEQVISGGVTPAARISTATAVAISNSAPASNTSVTFTATITPASSGAALTGTVQFTDNGVPLGAPVTVASNQASTSTTYSAAGSHTIQAIYSGDSHYAGSTGVPATLTVPGTVPTFSISASPASVSVAATGSQTTKIIASSTNGLNGTIYFTCSVASTASSAPSNIPTCSIPGSVTLSGSTASGSTTLTITTAASSGAIPGGAGGGVGPTARIAWLAVSGSGALACLFLLGAPGRKRRLSAVMAMVVVGFVLTLAGCGGGGSSSNNGSSTPTGPTTGSGGVPAGTYTVTVLGTGPGSSSPQTATVTVTVN